MERRFRKKQFVALGTLAADRIGLSARRTRELQLRDAWSQCAGPTLAAKGAAEIPRRGLLILRLHDDDPVWCRTLEDLAPELGAAISAHCPALGIQAVAVAAAEGAAGEPRALGNIPPQPSRRRSAAATRSDETQEWSAQRLDQLMRRYLARSSDASESPD